MPVDNTHHPFYFYAGIIILLIYIEVITIAYRVFDQHVKSLMHFDFPYYAEPNDGLGDEILGNIWKRNGNIKLVGTEAPLDEVVSGTPKFGYRCLQSAANTDYISATTDAFTFDSYSSYQFSFWIRATASQAGNVIVLLNGSTTMLTVGVDSTRHLTLNISSQNISVTSSNVLALNTWTQCQVQMSTSRAILYIDGTSTTASVSRGPLTVTECRIGGFAGQLDEFAFQSTLTEPQTVPMQGRLNLSSFIAYTSGTLGNVVISADCILNSVISARADPGISFGIRTYRIGAFGGFKDQGRIMLLDTSTGYYEFHTCTDRVIQNSSTLWLALQTGIDTSMDSRVWAKNHDINRTVIYNIPDFDNLTINAGATVRPQPWDGYGGGLVIFHCKGNCVINGNITTSGYGPTRSDSMQITHAKLIDNFVMNTGGGIIIVCDGTLTIGPNARLGGTWDGSAKGGVGATRSAGGNGGAGYGGAGNGDNQGGTGGNGGVGGGGGAFDVNNSGSGRGYDAGKANSAANINTGGMGVFNNKPTYYPGGTQGISVNGTDWGGGGGAGGNGGRYSTNDVSGYSGANIVLIAPTIIADAAALSTGGMGGMKSDCPEGGGGTGFCYIACNNIK